MPVDLPQAQKWVDYLNNLLQHDRAAVTRLFDFRTPCNRFLAEHPTVQTQRVGGAGDRVGFVGVLNGLVGVYDDGPMRGYGAVGYSYGAGTGDIVQFVLVDSKDNPPA